MISDTILSSLRDCLSPEKFTTSEFRDNNRIIVTADALFKTLECLKTRCGFDMLIDITAADYLHYPDAKDRFGVIYALLDTTSSGKRVAVRWRARGTFAGPAKFQAFEPNGAQIEIEGCDVLKIDHDLIQHNDAYLDSGDIARQLGFLPPAGSPSEMSLARLAKPLRSEAEGDSFKLLPMPSRPS